MRLFQNKVEISVLPDSSHCLTVGDRIRKFRKEKGWTQMKLGLACGFPPTTADVRIAHYEKNRKVPKKETRKQIADALEIDPLLLQYDEIITMNNKVYGLCLLEDRQCRENNIEMSRLSSCL